MASPHRLPTRLGESHQHLCGLLSFRISHTVLWQHVGLNPCLLGASALRCTERSPGSALWRLACDTFAYFCEPRQNALQSHPQSLEATQKKPAFNLNTFWSLELMLRFGS